jgi:putative tryptophan/tyrosine transport system substrate-binding protein
MRRWEFISLLGSAVAWPLAARAQQVRKPLNIGVLGANATVWAPWMIGFVARLRELGWVEGHTIAIEYRWTEGSAARVSEIGADFLRQNDADPMRRPLMTQSGNSVYMVIDIS